jgi:hypothetical protein
VARGPYVAPSCSKYQIYCQYYTLFTEYIFKVPFVSIVPAILLYILLFMETSVSELILMDKAKKGSGLHWDLLLLCVINVPVALFGGPWVYAAPLRAIAHLSALTVQTKDPENPHEVKDQRVTSLMVSILVGVSVLLGPFLQLVPLAVIYGVFLYMGVTSFQGLQFLERYFF